MTGDCFDSFCLCDVKNEGFLCKKGKRIALDCMVKSVETMV